MPDLFLLTQIQGIPCALADPLSPSSSKQTPNKKKTKPQKTKKKTKKKKKKPEKQKKKTEPKKKKKTTTPKPRRLFAIPSVPGKDLRNIEKGYKEGSYHNEGGNEKFVTEEKTLFFFFIQNH